MRNVFKCCILCMLIAACGEPEIKSPTAGEQPTATVGKKLFLDVHDVEPGKVTYEAVMEAHKKDLATEGKYGVNLQKFWVDEAKGKIYCLAEADNADSLYKTHKEAHGLVPTAIFEVTPGEEAVATGKQLYFDVHVLGPGNVTAAAVADAHKKDLAVQGKYGVNLLNYWVDEKKGVVMCLAEAADSSFLIKTHKEAHGLMANYTLKVKQGE